MSDQKVNTDVVSMTDLIMTRARESADSACIHTGHPDFGLEFKTLTYAQHVQAMDRLCVHYEHLQPECPSDQVPPDTVIAMLNSTAWEMTVLEMALIKLGLCPLLLSVNNSAAAVANLCKVTKATTLLYGPKFKETSLEAQEILAKEGIKLDLELEHRYPLWGKGGVEDSDIKPYKARLTPEQEYNRTALILHSSGSTGFPKPNYCTHKYMIETCKMATPYGSYSALPLYHGFGHQSSFRAMYFTQPITLFFPHLPLTAANIVRCYNTSPKVSPQQFSAVAYVLKLLAETEEGIEMLAKFDAVPFAGAAVPDDVGDRLVAKGVRLMSIFGATETGALLTSRRDFDNDKAWSYVRLEGKAKDHIVMEPRGENTFEIVVKSTWPALIAHNRPDGSYALKDLFVRHPEHPDWYKYVGRLDDTLTQTLGEKTNPVPMELAIRGGSPYVRECIVFGDGRPQIGCLLRPSQLAEDIWQDRAKYMDLVWPVIEAANKEAPSHSRILPEMVEILPPDTKIPVATKMSILRPACYKLFAPIIDAVYERFEQGSGDPKLNIDDKPTLENFIIETINNTLKAKNSNITPQTDLFAYGVDSLQATRIRNVLVQRLELGEGKELGQNIVYEHPSVDKLADYLLQVKLGNGGKKTDAQEHQVMESMLDKWFAKLQKPQSKKAAANGTANGHGQGEVVVLTGATGSLGAHLLDRLTSDPSVSRVICLSRAKSHADSTARLQESLTQRKRTLSPNSAAKITSYASDFNSDDKLGLTDAEYVDLQSATIVLHNAWPVNFILSTESYDAFVGGVTHLMNLATASGARFFFSSSVATMNGIWEEPVPEHFPDSPARANGTGYGRSKWVVEKIMEKAGKEYGSQVGVLRIGQLVGDAENGVFNETEAWPIMFKSANVVNALPQLDQPFSWLPVDYAARAIKEIVLTPLASTPSLFHILNPTMSSWASVLKGLAAGGLSFKPVERREWLAKVTEHKDPNANPAIKLVDFYTGRLGQEEEKRQMMFSVTETAKVSETLRSCPAISEEMVALWVKNWKKTGFLQ